MIALVFALVFLFVLMMAGLGLQQIFVYKSEVKTTVSSGVAVFIGLGLLLHLLNIIQLLNLPFITLLVITPLMLVGIKPFGAIIREITRHDVQILIVLILLIVMHLLLFKPDLPIMSWDSWLGWELKAKQWMAHGLSVDLLDNTQWMHQEGRYNATSHYPEGLPLMYYFFNSLGDVQNVVMSYIYTLSYFILVAELLFRLKEQGTKTMMMVWSVLLFTTLPLLNSHMNLQGYADIWIAMLLLLSVWALSDWNQNKSALNTFRLLVFLSMLPLFKMEGWVWLSLLLLSQFISKFLIRKHRWYVFGAVIVFVGIWYFSANWSFSWAARTFVFSQSFIKVAGVFELSLMPVNVMREVITGLYLQNNWGLLWYFLPFVLVFWVWVKHPKHQQVSQTFFVLSFTAFLVLFFYTDASKWAENYTAVNRIVLQLSPVFAYLVTQVFVTWQQKRAGEPALEPNKLS